MAIAAVGFAAAHASGAEVAPAPPASGAAAAALVPRALLFGNAERTQPRISPDGRWISFLAPVDGVMNVWVAPQDAPERARSITRDARRGIQLHQWARNSRQVLYLQDEAGDENFRLYAVDVTGGARVELTPLPKVRAIVVGTSHRHPDHVLVGLNDRDPRFHDVYRIDLRDGSRTLVERNDAGHARYLADPDLRLRLATRTLPTGAVRVERRDANGWTSVLDVPADDAETSRPVGIAPDGKSFYMLDTDGRDTAALTQIALDGSERRVLASTNVADVAGVWLEPRSQRADAYLVNHLRPEWTALSPAVGRDVEWLRSRMPDAFTVVSRSDDDRRWIVTEIRSHAPPRHHLYDRRARTLRLVFAENPALEAYALPRVEPVVIRARDGLSLVSYLTLPAGLQSRTHASPGSARVPLVLLVHGGPWARDSYGYSAEAQWLASRGYAVLRVNFRGSTGFGKRFVTAGDRQWGAAMHTDLLDAIDWAVAQGFADPERTAIFGGSYGGYAALAGLAFTPTRFACGVSIVGPSNLETLLATVPPYWESMREMLARRVGDPRTPEGRALLAERSPLHRAGAIVRPLLIGQGANDPRVKRAESDQIVAAMRERAIPVTYVLYPDEGHGFVRAPNRISFYAIAESFLGQCLGGRHEPIGTAFAGSSLEVLEGASGVPGLREALAAP